MELNPDTSKQIQSYVPTIEDVDIKPKRKSQTQIWPQHDIKIQKYENLAEFSLLASKQVVKATTPYIPHKSQTS